MKDRFFSKLDWAAFWTATVATFAVYFYTLGPSVGLEDSGELATAAANLGVPHPPGYPFWTFCSWLFCKAFSFVTYMGHPTPAWCVSLCSAVFGAFAAGCTAMLICRSGRDFVDGEEGPGAWLCFGGGVAGALTFALSPVEWSQSTIVEIYSLNALFLMWVFLLSYRWMRRPSDKILWTTAFVFGLGLTNYQVLLFAIVPLALVIAMKNIGMFRDVFIYLTPVALTYQVLQIGQLVRADRAMSADAINKHLSLKGATVPSTTVLVLGLAAIVVSVAAAAFLSRRGSRERARKVALFGGVGGVVLMLASMYIFSSISVWGGADLELAPLVEPWRYLLVAACAAGSVVAAALAALRPAEDPEPDGFAARVKAQFCCELWIAVALAALAVVFATMVPQAGDGGYLGPKYPWGKSTLVFVLVLAALFAMCSSTPRGLSFAVPVAGLHIAAFVLLSRGALNGLTHPTTWYFCWPIAWNFALLALSVLTLPNGLSVAGAAFFAQLGVSFYAYMPIVSDLRNPPMNWGYPRTWEGFKHAIMRGQYEAIGFQLPKWGAILEYFKDVRVQFTDVMIPFALVPFVAGRWIVRKENRKAFWQWMVPVLVCFLLMSVLLVGLANVKGDLQDGFIQKVKFISSHAMIALWIGYGLVFACAFALRKAGERGLLAGGRVRLAAFAAAALMIAVSFFAPLVDNYCGDYRLGVNEVAFKLGGSEQNGHTFGWQFGAYQLEGAKAINEQIEADEEPLPDPTWPPPMEKYSIFFGGTDPGRFVPTYMIYSALFRPDVYLITQNALADDTYMSVERDLYGDEIWIPSKEDSAEAFNVYVDEVQRGVRQANGDVKTHQDDARPRPPAPRVLRRGVVRHPVDVPVPEPARPHHEDQRGPHPIRREDRGEGPRLLGLVRAAAPERPRLPARLRRPEELFKAPCRHRRALHQAGPLPRGLPGLPRGVPPLPRLARGYVPLRPGVSDAVPEVERDAGADGLHRPHRPQQPPHPPAARLRDQDPRAHRGDRAARGQAPLRQSHQRGVARACALLLRDGQDGRGGLARAADRRLAPEPVRPALGGDGPPRGEARRRGGEGPRSLPPRGAVRC